MRLKVKMHKFQFHSSARHAISNFQFVLKSERYHIIFLYIEWQHQDWKSNKRVSHALFGIFKFSNGDKKALSPKRLNFEIIITLVTSLDE